MLEFATYLQNKIEKALQTNLENIQNQHNKENDSRGTRSVSQTPVTNS